MAIKHNHSFHIPIMGTSFTLDTPLKIARFGISSVITIADDDLCENARKIISKIYNIGFTPIKRGEDRYRVRRITEFLNFMNTLINSQIEILKKEEFKPGTEITKYFELLNDESPLKKQYQTMLDTEDSAEKQKLDAELRTHIIPGDIDVNIMTKVDRPQYSSSGEKLSGSLSNALTALEGYALSDLDSSVVFSAGFNGRLYGHVENFSDFFPDENGYIKKRIVLKVSDFRSYETQGRFFAKKGIWVSENRIESGINCGGHAFVKDGFLLGPILEEFKSKRTELESRFLELCNSTLSKKGKTTFSNKPQTRLTVQGGIGTFNEDQFLLKYYEVDGTGWASPFLLVPEVTMLDEPTRELLRKSTSEDLYTSGVSPLGIPFNAIKNTPSHIRRDERIKEGKPGSPCPKGYLALFNVEFSEQPICTASVTYQRKKIEALKNAGLTQEEYDAAYASVIEKVCLCEDLAAPLFISNNVENGRELNTEVCPGPNIAFFNKLFTLSEMVGHIYGRLNLICDSTRPHFFLNELKLNIDFLKKEVLSCLPKPTDKQQDRLNEIKQNLLNGINYYKSLIPNIFTETQKYRDTMLQDLAQLTSELERLLAANQVIFKSMVV